jgi:heme A synthase
MEFEMRLPRFALYAWGALIYNLGVILWGAYVRATGSGAGCGNHWPLCNGEIVPRSAQVETIIEFTHRVSSGLALLSVIGLLIWAFRVYPRRHRVRWGASFSMLFMITEALLGAGLVLFQLVADNTSIARALSMAAHLFNTFLLLASLTLTAWWSSGGKPLKPEEHKGLGGLLAVGLLGVLVLGMSGAVTALGDTLFPVQSLVEGFRQDFSPTAHLLIRLRVLHPLLAVSAALYLILVALFCSTSRFNSGTRQLSRVLILLLLVQLGAGVINVVRLAPVWIQLAHLLLSDSIWITLVLLAASALSKEATYIETVSLSPEQVGF